MHDETVQKMIQKVKEKEQELKERQADLRKILAKYEPKLNSNHAFCNTSKHRHFKIKDDGKTITYEADSQSSVLGKQLLHKKGKNSFNMQIDEHHNKITLGVATRKHDINALCGSDDLSWGFNVSEGKKIHNGEVEEGYGRRVHEGEKVTVTLDREHGTLSLAINGEDVGVGFEDEKLKTLKLHPCLSTEVVFEAKFLDGFPVQAEITNY